MQVQAEERRLREEHVAYLAQEAGRQRLSLVCYMEEMLKSIIFNILTL